MEEIKYLYQYTINVMNDHNAHYDEYCKNYLKRHHTLRTPQQKKEYREARSEYYDFMFARRNELHEYEKQIKALQNQDN